MPDLGDLRPANRLEGPVAAARPRSGLGGHRPARPGIDPAPQQLHLFRAEPRSLRWHHAVRIGPRNQADQQASIGFARLDHTSRVAAGQCRSAVVEPQPGLLLLGSVALDTVALKDRSNVPFEIHRLGGRRRRGIGGAWLFGSRTRSGTRDATPDQQRRSRQSNAVRKAGRPSASRHAEATSPAAVRLPGGWPRLVGPIANRPRSKAAHESLLAHRHKRVRTVAARGRPQDSPSSGPCPGVLAVLPSSFRRCDLPSLGRVLGCPRLGGRAFGPSRPAPSRCRVLGARSAAAPANAHAFRTASNSRRRLPRTNQQTLIRTFSL